MKKILVMGFNKIKYMPYINFYLDCLKEKECEIHILYWNRDLVEENLERYKNCFFHEFKRFQEDETLKIKKIISFIKYRKYVKKILTAECFDFIIVLHSLPGVLISNYLARKYKRKYIFDYRDSTYEFFKPFKRIISKLTYNSYATFVSSDAFRIFLPQEASSKIFTSHNILLDSLNHREEKMNYDIESKKIRISFWGFVRNEEINKEIISKISKDLRFELHYYGREQKIALSLKEYTKKIGSINVFFHGEYVPFERYNFVKNTDLIHNIYYDKNMMLAMGNKYYDSIIFGIPQLCMEGSFMGEIADKKGVGLSCNPYDDDFLDKIYNYFKNLCREDFYKNCNKELERVLFEYKEAEKKINEIG